MRAPCGILFIYIPFSNDIESGPYISFIRIVEAPVSYPVSFMYFKFSPANKCKNAGSICPPIWEGESTWFCITCLHIVWSVSPSVNLITSLKKRLFSSLHDSHCLVKNILARAVTWSTPQCHPHMEGWLRFLQSFEGSFFRCVARDAGGFSRYLAFSWHTE